MRTGSAGLWSASFWRRVGARVCLVAIFLLAPLALLAWWTGEEMGNTDRYVATVAPLADDSAVQTALSDRITDEITSAIALDRLTDEATRTLERNGAFGELSGLVVSVRTAIHDIIQDRVEQVISSPGFKRAWVETNREAHRQLVSVLTGADDPGVVVDADAVRVNIAPYIGAAKQLLLDEGFTFAKEIPTINATVTVVQSEDVPRAQSLFALLETLHRLLPILVILLSVAAILVATDRRHALLTLALTVGGSMLALGVVLNLTRSFYLGAIPTHVIPSDAAAAVYDVLIRFLSSSVRLILAVAVVSALAITLTAPNGQGAAARGGINRALQRLWAWVTSRELDPAAIEAFMSRYRALTHATVAIVAAVFYLSLRHPGPRWTAGVAAGVAILAGGLEIARRRAAKARYESNQDENVNGSRP
jgi:hypothetical protein